MKTEQLPVKSSGLKVQSLAVLEINDLHNKIMGSARTTLERAIHIGELLTEQKAKQAHGEWLPWIEANLVFDRMTAARYMRVFDRRQELNVTGVLHLAAAYRLLSECSSVPPPRATDPKAAAHLPGLEAIIQKDLDGFNTGLSAIKEYLDLGGRLSNVVTILKDAGVRSEVILMILELASEQGI